MTKFHPFSKIKLTTVALAALAAAFLTYRILTGLLYPAAPSLASDLTVGSILNAVNQERSNRNIITLNTNSILTSAADYKSHDMVTRKYFSHTDPEGNYIWPKIASLGYAPYSMLGENLAIEFYSTESLMQAWMDSPTHRANVLQDGFRDQGVGLAFGNVQNGEYGTSIANTFGTLLVKKTPPPAPPVTTKKATPKPATKPVAKKPAPKPATKKISYAVKAAETKVEEAVEEIKNLHPISPRGLANALSPLIPVFPETNKTTTNEPSFETGQNLAAPAVPETQAPTSAYQESPTKNSNPYQQYKLWGIIIAIGALGLLALETRKYLKEKIHIPRHRWNTILMLILTLLVTGLAYII